MSGREPQAGGADTSSTRHLPVRVTSPGLKAVLDNLPRCCMDCCGSVGWPDADSRPWDPMGTGPPDNVDAGVTSLADALEEQTGTRPTPCGDCDGRPVCLDCAVPVAARQLLREGLSPSDHQSFMRSRDWFYQPRAGGFYSMYRTDLPEQLHTVIRGLADFKSLALQRQTAGYQLGLGSVILFFALTAWAEVWGWSSESLPGGDPGWISGALVLSMFGVGYLGLGWRLWRKARAEESAGARGTRR